MTYFDLFYYLMDFLKYNFHFEIVGRSDRFDVNFLTFLYFILLFELSFLLVKYVFLKLSFKIALDLRFIFQNYFIRFLQHVYHYQ